MHMQMAGFDFFVCAVQRRLVDAHAVREMRLEQVVVAAGDLGECFGEVGFFGGGEVDQGAFVVFGDDHGFEGPDGPPGADDQEGGVGEDDALVLFGFELGVVLEEVEAALLPSVLSELLEFQRWFFG